MPTGKIDPGSEPAWITLEHARDLHALVIHLNEDAEDGDLNIGHLDSAIHAPRNTLYYSDGGCDLFDLAAVYLYHIAKAHAFVDGNKRTAYLTALVFLQLNGFEVLLPENVLKLAGATEAAAKNEVDRAGLAEIMRTMPRMRASLAVRRSRPRYPKPRKASNPSCGAKKRAGRRKTRKRFF